MGSFPFVGLPFQLLLMDFLYFIIITLFSFAVVSLKPAFFYKSEKRSKYGLEVRWGGTGRSNESRILISKRIEYIVRDKNVLLVKRKKIKEIKNNPLKAKHHFGKFDSINQNTISLLSYMKKKVECY